MVSITVEELRGDADDTQVYLNTPVEAVPGGGDPGSSVMAKVVEVYPGLSFLVVSADQGDSTLAVEELDTGHPDVDTSRYIVATKDMVSAEDGTELTGYLFPASNGGSVLLVELPAGPQAGGGGTGATPAPTSIAQATEQETSGS